MSPISAEDREIADDRFLASCLKAYRKDQNKASPPLSLDDNPQYWKANMSAQVDMSAVAQTMGYANPKSAGNRWAALKKKHGIDLDAFYAPTVCIYYSSSLYSADIQYQTAGAKVAKPAGGASKAQGTKRTPKKSAAKGTKKGPAQQSDDEETPADQPADEATADEA